jgi:hypothetical protein
MFTPDKIFATQNQKAGKPEWYFQAREGNVGPYETRNQAELMLKKFIETCIELGYSGGRKQESKNSPAAVKIQSFLHYELKGDLHWV